MDLQLYSKFAYKTQAVPHFRRYSFVENTALSPFTNTCGSRTSHRLVTRRQGVDRLVFRVHAVYVVYPFNADVIFRLVVLCPCTTLGMAVAKEKKRTINIIVDVYSRGDLPPKTYRYGRIPCVRLRMLWRVPRVFGTIHEL